MKQILKYILALNIEHQKMSETKHSITVALASGIIVVLVGWKNNANLFLTTMWYVAILNCFLSILFSFVALSSKSIVIKSKKHWNKKDINMTYFKHLAHLDIDEFCIIIKQNYDIPPEYKIDTFETDLIRQILAVSKRVNSKYQIFNISLALLVVGVIVGLVGFVFGGVIWLCSSSLTSGC